MKLLKCRIKSLGIDVFSYVCGDMGERMDCVSDTHRSTPDG